MRALRQTPPTISRDTEAVAIDYDPTVTSYENLLDRFWNAHRCSSAGGKGQYMIAVFYHNEGQKKLAEKENRMEEAKECKKCKIFCVKSSMM